MENCGVKYTSYAGSGYSEDKIWKGHNNGKSRFETANLVEVLLHKEKATQGIDIGRRFVDVTTPCEEPRAEPSNTERGHLDAADDKVSMEVVEAKREIEDVLKPNKEVAMIQQDQTPLTVQGTKEQLHKAGGNPIDAEIVGAVQDLKKTEVEDMNIKGELDAGLGKPLTFALPQSTVEGDPVDPRTIVNHADEQQTSVSQTASKLVEVLLEASEQGNPSLKTKHGIGAKCEDGRIEAVSMELPNSFVTPDDSSMTPIQMTCQRPPGHGDDTFQIVSRNADKQDTYVQEFSISIYNRLANVEARTLPLPRVKYHDTSWEECIPSISQRNIMHKKMVNGGSVRYWAYINFSQYVTAEIAP
jgi:hypothetical protein